MVGAFLRTGRAMNISNGAAPSSLPPAKGFAALSAPLRRIVDNLARWIVVLGRAPRARPPRWPAGTLLAIALTVGVVVAAMFLIDTRASDWARQLPRWLIDVADEITIFGLSGWFLYPLGFVLLLLAAITTPSLPRMTQGALALLVGRFGFLFVAIGLPGLFVTIVKRMIGRARPYVGPHDDPFAYKPFIWRPEYSSMPSGHATTATAAAIAIGAIWPRSRVVMWLYALIIMLTRVVINVHHPSDVIAGALVGVVGALMVRRWFAARGLVFDAGDLRPFPGPSRKRLKTAARDVLAGLP
jgi:membrane-associated phospholipid phosphatase